MSQAILSQFGSQFDARRVGGGSATAAGTGDNTEVTGAAIDLNDFRSGSLLVLYTAALAATKTLTFTVRKQQSADNITFDAAESVQTITVAATGQAGGSTETGVFKVDINFEGDKRYQKLLITPDLSNTATDTCAWQAALVRGGARNQPVS